MVEPGEDTGLDPELLGHLVDLGVEEAPSTRLGSTSLTAQTRPSSRRSLAL